jgi:chromate reductase
VTSSPYRVIAFSGSLRTGSSNTALLHMARRLAPTALDIEIIDWIVDLPWMNPDLESDPPPVVQRWWDTVRTADAVLIALPEYNWSPSPLAKNAIDWATRPVPDRSITGRVVALMTSASRSGGSNAQGPLTTILGLLGATVVEEPPVQLALVADRINADGTTSDPEIERLVTAKLEAVVAALAAR